MFLILRVAPRQGQGSGFEDYGWTRQGQRPRGLRVDPTGAAASGTKGGTLQGQRPLELRVDPAAGVAASAVKRLCKFDALTL